MLHDAVRDAAGLDMRRPAHEHRDAERAFPVRVLLAAERRHCAVRPRVHVWAVVGRVHDERVVGDAELVEQVEHLSDIFIVIDHRVVVPRLPLAGLADALRLGVREKMHVRRVEPDEERLARLVLAADEILGRVAEFVVAVFHALLRERARVLDLLLADAAPALLDFRIILVLRPAMQHAARTECVAEARVLRVVLHLGFFFGIEVIKVAEEFVEAMHGRQEFVEIAEVVLAELAGRVTLILEQIGDRHRRRLQALWRGRNADLGKAGAIDALPRDERRAPGCTRLLAVRVGEHHAFLREAIDVRRLIAHEAMRVAAEIGLPDVVAPR